MCFNTFALVIYHSLHPKEAKVPLGAEFAMLPYILLFNYKGKERFSYFLDEGRYMLTMDSCLITYPALSFTDTDVNAIVAQLAIPAASERKVWKGGEGVLLLPTHKCVSVLSLLDEVPKLLPSVPVSGKFLATTLRVQVDFGELALLMQIPRADWLYEAQGVNR
ncbi:hypothetical protein EJ02DRAFT_159660 [Clathrospora elynae]|uniref:Uncharacterized protein n=1 Tax=Clathrospora elynae TaxID=706981 RepID=A0A6A5SSI1_9PLEO|nr:hypothetical protein EJ02DRAFT_159660 [Clathrospora elynae]